MTKQEAFKQAQQAGMRIVRVGAMEMERDVTYQQMVDEICRNKVDVSVNGRQTILKLNKYLRFVLLPEDF